MSSFLPYIPEVIKGDWNSVINSNRLITQCLQRISSFTFGPSAVPTFGSFILDDLTASRLIYTNSSKQLSSVSNLASWVAGTANEIDIGNDGDGSITIGLVNPLIVGKGGSGAATFTDHSILLGSGTDAFTALGAATNGQLPIGSTGADPVLAVLTEGEGIDVTNAAGSITISGENASTTNKGISSFSATNFSVTDGAVSLLAGGGLNHNDLGSIQGGTTNEYYHLTSARHTKLAAIADLSVTDGNVIVGNGTTWVAESENTARTSLGLGSGNGPTFEHLHIVSSTGSGSNISISDTGTLTNITTATYCIGIGRLAGESITEGLNNVFIGNQAGRYTTTGSYNFGMGSGALTNNITGSGNLALGRGALYGSSGNSSNNCVAIGQQAGSTAYGTGNVFVGNQAGYRQGSVSNLLIIDNQDRGSTANELSRCLLYGVFNATASSQTLRCNAKFGVNCTPGNQLSINGISTLGDGGTTNYTQISATGDITFAGSSGFYPRFLTQADEPAAGTGATQCDTSELVIWKDSDDSKVYLCFNDSGTVKTVELV